MSLIPIKDGERKTIYFESLEIVAVRERDDKSSYIFLKGDGDPWIVECDINTVISKIPIRE